MPDGWMDGEAVIPSTECHAINFCRSKEEEEKEYRNSHCSKYFLEKHQDNNENTMKEEKRRRTKGKMNKKNTLKVTMVSQIEAKEWSDYYY